MSSANLVLLGISGNHRDESVLSAVVFCESGLTFDGDNFDSALADCIADFSAEAVFEKCREEILDYFFGGDASFITVPCVVRWEHLFSRTEPYIRVIDLVFLVDEVVWGGLVTMWAEAHLEDGERL